MAREIVLLRRRRRPCERQGGKFGISKMTNDFNFICFFGRFHFRSCSPSVRRVFYPCHRVTEVIIIAFSPATFVTADSLSLRIGLSLIENLLSDVKLFLLMLRELLSIFITFLYKLVASSSWPQNTMWVGIWFPHLSLFLIAHCSSRLPRRSWIISADSQLLPTEEERGNWDLRVHCSRSFIMAIMGNGKQLQGQLPDRRRQVVVAHLLAVVVIRPGLEMSSQVWWLHFNHNKCHRVCTFLLRILAISCSSIHSLACLVKFCYN